MSLRRHPMGGDKGTLGTVPIPPLCGDAGPPLVSMETGCFSALPIFPAVSHLLEPDLSPTEGLREEVSGGGGGGGHPMASSTHGCLDALPAPPQQLSGAFLGTESCRRRNLSQGRRHQEWDRDLCHECCWEQAHTGCPCTHPMRRPLSWVLPGSWGCPNGCSSPPAFPPSRR